MSLGCAEVAEKPDVAVHRDLCSSAEESDNSTRAKRDSRIQGVGSEVAQAIATPQICRDSIAMGVWQSVRV